MLAAMLTCNYYCLPNGRMSKKFEDLCEQYFAVQEKSKKSYEGKSGVHRTIRFYACVDMEHFQSKFSGVKLQEYQDFTMAVYRTEVSTKQYSHLMLAEKHQHYALDRIKFKAMTESSKLVSSTLPKIKYWVTGTLLRFLVDTEGWRVKKIDNVLECCGTEFLRDYVAQNQKRRGFAKSSGESIALKLLNNSVYGILFMRKENSTNTEILYDEKRSYEVVDIFYKKLKISETQWMTLPFK